MPLTSDERDAEIQRRNKAGSGAIPSPQEGETIVQLYGIAGSMYVLSQYATYRMRSADEIDPEVTAIDVPWSIGKYLDIGTTHSLIASSFGVYEQLARNSVIPTEVKANIPEFLIQFAVSCAELKFAKSIYDTEINSFLSKDETVSNELVIDGTTAQLPRIDCFEISFGLFYLSAKKSIGCLLALLEWACGYDVTHRTHLDKLITKMKSDKTLSKMHPLINRLEGFSEAIKLLNEIRNAFEHPSEKRSIQLSNIALQPNKDVRLPTWTLIHDEIELPENQDHGIHLEAVTDMIARFAEQVVLFVGAIKDDGTFVWTAEVRADIEIEPNFPCRWKVAVLGFTDQTSEKL